MIQPLRSVHYRAALALPIVLAAILSAGLLARRSAPPPAQPSSALPPFFKLLAQSSGGWADHDIETAFYLDEAPPNDFFVVLRPAQPLGSPDNLVYWSESKPDNNVLPDSARLIGALEPPRPLRLPLEIQPGSYLILYSLAHQTIVDTFVLEKLP